MADPVGIPSATYISGSQVRAKLNTDLMALCQLFASASAPTDTAAHMLWFDTTNDILKIRNEADSAWVELFYFDGSDYLHLIGPTRILENSDTITITHDGTDATIKWSDGEVYITTDEGTNTDTVVNVAGKGTGKGKIRIWDQSKSNYIELNTADAIGANRTFALPSDAPADGEVLTYDSGTSRTEWATPTGGAPGAGSLTPNTMQYDCQNGLTNAPTYMVFTGTSATVSISTTTQFADDGKRATILSASSGATYYGWDTASSNLGSVVDVESLRGQKFTMGAWVYATTASRVCLQVGDGTTTTSGATHGGAGWEWMTVTLAANVASAATDITAYVVIDAGAQITIYVERPCTAEGETLNYPVPYMRGGRMGRASLNAGWAAGARSATGIGFSPSMVLYLGYQSSQQSGSANLISSVITQDAQATGGNKSTSHISYHDASNHMVCNTMDEDGASFTVTGATAYGQLIFFEGPMH